MPPTERDLALARLQGEVARHCERFLKPARLERHAGVHIVSVFADFFLGRQAP